MTRLRTPIVTVITGEGGSGGALAIAVGDVVIALENATYSVITPEGCALDPVADPERPPAAALAMRMTAADQLELGVVDAVLPEPGDGAQSDHAETARRLRTEIVAQLDALSLSRSRAPRAALLALPVDGPVRGPARRRTAAAGARHAGRPAAEPRRGGPTVAGRAQRAGAGAQRTGAAPSETSSDRRAIRTTAARRVTDERATSARTGTTAGRSQSVGPTMRPSTASPTSSCRPSSAGSARPASARSRSAKGAWRVRLRRPAGAERTVPRGGRAARRSRTGPRERAHRPAATSPLAPARPRARATDRRAVARSADGDLPSLTSLPDPGSTTRVGPLVATSPAVGSIACGPASGAGSKVRAGDRSGSSTCSGVPVEVASPADGIVAADAGRGRRRGRVRPADRRARGPAGHPADRPDGR